MRNLLFFFLILIGVYYLRRLLAGEKSDEDSTHAAQANRSAEPAREIEQVVPCAHCGLLVPASEGVEANGHFFCSLEHQTLGPSAS